MEREIEGCKKQEEAEREPKKNRRKEGGECEAVIKREKREGLSSKRQDKESKVRGKRSH